MSIFGEKKGLVLWVDQNTWVVYITVVLLGTLEKWEARGVTSVGGCWPQYGDVCISGASRWVW